MSDSLDDYDSNSEYENILATQRNAPRVYPSDCTENESNERFLASLQSKQQHQTSSAPSTALRAPQQNTRSEHVRVCALIGAQRNARPHTAMWPLPRTRDAFCRACIVP